MHQWMGCQLAWRVQRETSKREQEKHFASLARRVNLQTKMANLNAKYVSQVSLLQGLAVQVAWSVHAVNTKIWKDKTSVSHVKPVKQ